MGREIRRVPPNWQHPKYDANTTYDERKLGQYIPLHDGYDRDLERFKDSIEDDGLGKAIDDWGGGPESEDYVHYKEEPTWYQVYETVSEGSPVTPPFETEDELVNYLVEYGDFWSQKRPEFYGKYSREAAEKFVKGDGYACSMTINNGVVRTGIETVLT